MADTMFGWESTFKIVQNSIKRKADIIVAFIHWYLIKRGFRVLDNVEDLTLHGGEVGTEVLPDDWNAKDKYVLRYLYKDKLFILHATETQSCLIINLVRSEDNSVQNVALNPDTMVKSMEGKIEVMIPEYTEFIHNIKTNLIDPVADKSTSNTETQTHPTPSSTPSVDTNPRPARPQNPWQEHDIENPRLVGSSDLHPFGGGGGMLFDPFGAGFGRGLIDPGHGIPGGIPRGSVPPGARFDPFAPPGVGPMPNRRRPPPDADHFPPPGADDMFM